MVSSSTSTPAMDTDFVAFIKEFLFNPSPRQDPSAARSVLRHQRTPPRHKRSRILWRAAATSLMKKRYSSQDTRLPPFADHLLEELPSHVSIDNGTSSEEAHLHSSQTTHLPSAQQLHRGLASEFSLSSPDKHLINVPLEVSADDGHASQATHSFSANQLLTNSPSHVFLDDRHGSHAIDSLSTDQFPGGDGLTTIDSPQHKHTRVDIDALKEAPLVTPACLNSTRKGSSRGSSSKVQHLEAPSTPTVPKRSSRKPPRPPRSSMSRSGSYRAVRLKNASRRAIADNVRLRKQKSLKSSSNATPTWALIITLCFVIIMLVQGFLGSNSKELDSKAEVQSVGEGISSLSSHSGIPPLSSTERTTQAFVLKHEAASSFDQLQQKKERDSLFVNLQRRRLRKLGATTWLLS